MRIREDAFRRSKQVKATIINGKYAVLFAKYVERKGPF